MADYIGKNIRRRPELASKIIVLILVIFSTGVICLTGKGQQQFLGGLLVVTFVMFGLRGFGRGVPLEPIYYFTWVCWCSAGFLFAQGLQQFYDSFRVIVQIAIMFFAVAGLSAQVKSVYPVSLGIALGGLIQFLFSFSFLSFRVGELLTAEQIVGLTSNANTYGFSLVVSTAGALMLWGGSRGGILWEYRRKIIILTVTLCGLAILASGSKKSFIAFVILCLGWIFILNSRNRANLIGKIIIFFLGLTCLSLFVDFALKSSIIGLRFQYLLKAGDGDVFLALTQHDRFQMYVEGFKMFIDNPIFGVGLGNFQLYYYTGQYSHSDYIEPLATTGLPGFLIYFATYATVLLRLNTLLKRSLSGEEFYIIKMSQLFMVVVFFVGIGAPHYASNPTWLFIGAISGFTWRLTKNLHSN